MFLTLIRREILANLMTFRFFVAMIICLLLVVVNSIVLIQDYEHRLADYNNAVQKHREKRLKAPVYSFLKFSVDYPPNPMGIYNQGIERNGGNTFPIHHNLVPCLWDGGWYGSDNSFLVLFSKIDLTFIFRVVLILLAMLFAYDAVAGEREGGTLRLMMTTAASRGLILVAKYISAMACLIVPLLISLILAQILFTTSGSISLSGADWLRISGIALISIVYLSGFYLIGLVISIASHRTATALMLATFLWVVLVLIYPSLSGWTVRRFWLTGEETKRAAREELEQLWDTYEQEVTNYVRNDPVLGEMEKRDGRWVNSLERVGWNLRNRSVEMESGWGNIMRYLFEGLHFAHIPPESEHREVSAVKAYFQFSVPLQIRYGQQTWQVRQKVLSQVYGDKAKMQRSVMRLSPAAMYHQATAALAGTDFHGMVHFIEQVQGYRQAIIDYFHDKGAFSSRQWFSDDKGRVDWEDLPQFSYRRADVWTSARHALPNLALLLLINVLMFMAGFLIFVRQEI